jgi:queuine tRNA-ribosyltransferase
MSKRLNFKLEARASGSRARATRFSTLHNEVLTPVFMPVGTQATVKGLTVDDLTEAGAQVLLANTYHLLLRPGTEVFSRLGGIHRFMQWDRSVLTDSGGFQIFSLSNDRKITEEGAAFRSYVDGSRIVLSPELSIDAQKAIGSDIMMVLDQCIPSTSDHAAATAAMELTHRWARRSLDARGNSPQSLFGIVQGACFEDLRRRSADALTQMPFDGFAIGGLAVGESKDQRETFTELTAELLPADLPRYLMGVGTPIDLLEAVHRGVDMFDCILPSSLAKQGVAFTSAGRLNLYRGVYKFADEAVDPLCDCTTCARYSRAYVHHLTKAGEVLGWQLLTRHNLRFYHNLMAAMRRHILADTFADFYRVQREVLVRADEDNPSIPGKVRERRRGRHDTTALERFEVRTSAEGFSSIADRSSGEIMHAGLDPDAESRALYVEQSRLAARLAEADEADRELVVWDVGLGAAHNARAAIQCAEAVEGGLSMRLVSFENDLGALRLALRNPKAFPHLQAAGPNLLLRSGQWQSEKAPLRWELLEGDFLVRIAEAPLPDLIFYDPFSPKTDGDLWTFDCFEELFSLCGDHDTELFTYSASTAVRAAMLAAGFYVAKGAPTGTKGETTIAMTPAAALAHAERGRELLGEAWLERWRRSEARFPRDVVEGQEADFASRILAHPQFQSAGLSL